MADYRLELIQLLASGECYSGNALAERFGVSRTAIWKQVEALEGMGLAIERLAGRGYRLQKPFITLSSVALGAALGPIGESWFPSLQVCSEVESTNQEIAGALTAGAASGTVCLAEYQHAGRGRRGRVWHAPYGQNLCFSLLWRYESGPGALGALSLAVAVAVRRGLLALGIPGIGIKWPNDLVCGGSKLAGILLEVQGESAGPSSVVVGIGLNVNMTSDQLDQQIDQPWQALAGLAGVELDRNRVAAAILLELGAVLSAYEQGGFLTVADEFAAADVLRGREVMLVQGAEQPRPVQVHGVAADGGLLVQSGAQRETVYSGEVSVRSWSGLN